jgi:hypothetical protein
MKGLNHMKPSTQLEQKADTILSEIAALGPMRKGSLCRRILKRKNTQGQIRRRGPYWYYSFKKKDRSVSKMIKDSEVEFFKEQIKKFRRFQELTIKYVEISQRMADRDAKKCGGKKNSRA